MNREQAKKLLPYIQAWSEGKQIQFRREGEVDWVDCNNPEFIGGYEYRIKPEIVEYWVVGSKNYCGSSKDSREAAETFLAELRADSSNELSYEDWRVFKVREVEE